MYLSLILTAVVRIEPHSTGRTAALRTRSARLWLRGRRDQVDARRRVAEAARLVDDAALCHDQNAVIVDAPHQPRGMRAKMSLAFTTLARAAAEARYAWKASSR